MLRYDIKVYDIGYVYKSTINPQLIKSSVNFTSNINGGLWRLSIELNIPINSTLLDLWDIIEVYAFSE